jgi:hypothetical protein
MSGDMGGDRMFIAAYLRTKGYKIVSYVGPQT